MGIVLLKERCLKLLHLCVIALSTGAASIITIDNWGQLLLGIRGRRSIGWILINASVDLTTRETVF